MAYLTERNHSFAANHDRNRSAFRIQRRIDRIRKLSISNHGARSSGYRNTNAGEILALIRQFGTGEAEADRENFFLIVPNRVALT